MTYLFLDTPTDWAIRSTAIEVVQDSRTHAIVLQHLARVVYRPWESKIDFFMTDGKVFALENVLLSFYKAIQSRISDTEVQIMEIGEDGDADYMEEREALRRLIQSKQDSTSWVRVPPGVSPVHFALNSEK